MEKKWFVHRNMSLFLSIVVFLSGCTTSFHTDSTKKIHLALEGPKQIPVQASIAPITFSNGGFHLKWQSLATLKEVEQQRTYPVSVFRGFLPRKTVSVGKSWEINPEAALQLLKQLAEKPQLEMHPGGGTSFSIGFLDKTLLKIKKDSESEGLWALLRAYNDRYAEIVFRIHAEFALEGGFFTPSQFAGRLILDRQLQELAYFEMSVPASTLNFDVNRKYPDGHIGTDAGVCQIEMTAGEDTAKGITFLTEIPMTEAQLALAKQFYKAQAIEWVPLDKAIEMAKSLDRPIHVISADGTFMDESC